MGLFTIQIAPFDLNLKFKANFDFNFNCIFKSHSWRITSPSWPKDGILTSNHVAVNKLIVLKF
jgi:hypothetical protein